MGWGGSAVSWTRTPGGERSVNRFGVVQLLPGHTYRVVCVPVVNLSNQGVARYGLVQPAPEHVHWVVFAPVANHLGFDKLV